MSTLGFVASLAMALGAPLVYADQSYSIQKKRSSVGFSKDVCAVLLLANIARCFWWLEERFEVPLLLQSVLMILSQLALLALVLKYREGSFASSAFTSSSEDYAHGRDPGPAAGRGPLGTPRVGGGSSRSAQEQGQAGEREALRSSPRPSTAATQAEGARRAPPTRFAALFGGGPSRGGYAPVLSGLRLPALPLLARSGGREVGEEEEEEEEDEEEQDQQPTSLLTRTTRRATKAARKGGVQLKTLLGVRTDGSLRQDGSSSGRPLGFWTWTTMPSYLAFLFLYSVFLAILHLLFSSSSTYSSLLGLYALGLESTLPLPQLIANQRRHSLSGFRLSVLAGWLLGDLFKTIYFLLKSSPLPFLLGGIFALSIDLAIVVQSRVFKQQTEKDDEDEEEERKRRGQEALRIDQEATAIRRNSLDPLDVSSRRRREEELDEELQDHHQQMGNVVLFDSVNGQRGSSTVAEGGGDLSSGSKVFTIEADED